MLSSVAAALKLSHLVKPGNDRVEQEVNDDVVAVEVEANRREAAIGTVAKTEYTDGASRKLSKSVVLSKQKLTV